MKKILIIAITIIFIIIIIFTIGTFRKELSLNLAPVDFSLNKKDEYNKGIKVTGSAKRDFTSDIIAWSATFSVKNMELKKASDELNKERKIIKEYLSKNNIPTKDILFTAINLTEKYKTEVDEDGVRKDEFDGYHLQQNIIIESRAVETIEALSRDITNLIDYGVEIQSNPSYYFYSKLEDLKIDLIAEATKNAQERATKIIENSNSKMGQLITAQMGVFQIVAKNSTENYSWGGTHNKTSRNKTANITMKLNYKIAK